MKITYFGIKNCEYEMVAGYPAIIAPEGIDEEVLKRNNFVQLIDGRWYHFMTDAENEYYMNNSNAEKIEFSLQQMQESKDDSNITIFFVFIISFGISFIFIDFIFGISILAISFLTIFYRSTKISGKIFTVIFTIIFILLSITIFYRFDDACDKSDSKRKRKKNESCGDGCFHEFQKILIMGSQHIYYWE